MKTYYGSGKVLLEYLSTDILDDVWSNVLHVVGHHHLNFSAITTYVQGLSQLTIMEESVNLTRLKIQFDMYEGRTEI